MAIESADEYFYVDTTDRFSYHGSSYATESVEINLIPPEKERRPTLEERIDQITDRVNVIARSIIEIEISLIARNWSKFLFFFIFYYKNFIYF